MSETNQPSSETLLTQPVSRLFFQYFRSNLVSSLMLAVYVLFGYDLYWLGCRQSGTCCAQYHPPPVTP